MTMTYNVIIKSNGALIVERPPLPLHYVIGQMVDAFLIDDVVYWFIQFALSFRNA